MNNNFSKAVAMGLMDGICKWRLSKDKIVKNVLFGFVYRHKKHNLLAYSSIIDPLNRRYTKGGIFAQKKKKKKMDKVTATNINNAMTDHNPKKL